MLIGITSKLNYKISSRNEKEIIGQVTGIKNNNSYFFDIYSSGGVRYKNKELVDGFVSTTLTKETNRRSFNNFIAFDLFLKNETGSPISDNLYLENLSKNSDEQTELMRASLGITHGMMSPIEVVSKNDMYLSMSQNPTVSKEVTPIDFKGVSVIFLQRYIATCLGIDILELRLPLFKSEIETE